MRHEEVKRRLLSNPEVRQAYENPPLPLAAARSVVERRKELGMTQKDLADSLETSQAQVWRIESGQFNPTLKTLSRLEKVLDIQLVPTGGVPEDSDRSNTPHEQLEEWIEYGLIVMDDESQRVAFEEIESSGLATMVERLRSFVEGLEEHEQVEVLLQPVDESEHSSPVGEAHRQHRRRMELAVLV